MLAVGRENQLQQVTQHCVVFWKIYISIHILHNLVTFEVEAYCQGSRDMFIQSGLTFYHAVLQKETSPHFPVGPNQVLSLPSYWYKYMCNARVRGTKRMIQLKIKTTSNTYFLVYTQY